ncbi:chorismate synthase [Bacilli bacterium PM5-3]|nr:chorismate synthase [Bacilli bacterium PM5-3]
MKSNFIHNLKFTLFGQSHDDKIGIIIENIPSNHLIDFNEINKELMLRQGSEIFNTPRQEKIKYDIVSGFSEVNKDNQAITINEPIKVFFVNEDVKNTDYDNVLKHPRPGHVDYVASMKYQEAHTIAGGGHFSGRMTLPLVFLGAICQQILFDYYPNMSILSHINSFASYKDIGYYDLRKFLVEKIVPSNVGDYTNIHLKLLATKLKDNLHKILLNGIKNNNFPTFNKETYEKMYKAAQNIENDSLGGQIETIVINPPAFIGEPFFYSFESVLSGLLYSIPGIKDVAFGNHEEFKNNFGSKVKDEIIYLDNKKLTTFCNNNGGINGGITNGEDIVYSTIVKPIASISQPQLTYSIEDKKLSDLEITGRHDKTIINRIIPVINAMAYITIFDLCFEDINQK